MLILYDFIAFGVAGENWEKVSESIHFGVGRYILQPRAAWVHVARLVSAEVNLAG